MRNENSGPSCALSIIIPCYNEEESIAEAVEKITNVVKCRTASFEILLINDGSRDGTAEVAQTIAEANDRVREVSHMRNFGQTQAYQSGFNRANGAYVILYSADLETPPDMILKVVDELDKGADFVNTWRKDRWAPMHALKSSLANVVLNRISKVAIRDRGSGLKGMRWEIAKSFSLYGEWHRFLPDYATMYTDRIVEIEVPFVDRKAGVSSYKGRVKTVSVILDLATVAFFLSSQKKPFLMLPGRLFGFTGTLLTIVGAFTTGWLVASKLFFGESLSERPLFLIAILLSVLGVTMIMVGVLGELVLALLKRVDGEPLVRKGRTRGPDR